MLIRDYLNISSGRKKGKMPKFFWKKTPNTIYSSSLRKNSGRYLLSILHFSV